MVSVSKRNSRARYLLFIIVGVTLNVHSDRRVCPFRGVEGNPGPRDILSEDVRDRHPKDEQETEIHLRHNVRVLQPTEVRRRWERRLPWRSAIATSAYHTGGEAINAKFYLSFIFPDIRIHFALREPHSKLFRSTDANKLLVVTYAWDGNALPGCRTIYINKIPRTGNAGQRKYTPVLQWRA